MTDLTAQLADVISQAAMEHCENWIPQAEAVLAWLAERGQLASPASERNAPAITEQDWRLTITWPTGRRPGRCGAGTPMLTPGVLGEPCILPPHPPGTWHLAAGCTWITTEGDA